MMVHPSTSRRSRSTRAVAALLLLATAGCDGPTSARGSGVPASIAIMSGDEQTSAIGEPLKSELTVVVRDSAGAGVPGVGVVFWYTDFENHPIDLGLVLTDAAGVGRFGWQPTGLAGSRVINAGVATDRDRIRTVFVLHLNPGPASRIEVLDAMQDVYAGAAARPPFFRVTDAFGNAVAGVRTLFNAGEAGAQVTGAEQITLSNGVVAPAAWTVGPDTGIYTLVASIGAASATARAHARSGPPATIKVLEGATVQTAPGGRVWDVTVRVADAFDRPVPFARVEWSSSTGLRDCASATDASGLSRLPCTWTLGTATGQYTLDIVSGAARAQVFASVVPPPSAITFLTPTANSAYPAGALLSDSVRVAVTGADGAPASGIVVSFSLWLSMRSGGPAPVTTDANGIAATAWRLPDEVGPVMLIAAPQGYSTPTAAVMLYGTGALRLSGIAAGSAFTCGISTAQLRQSTYCWGRNQSGELADGSMATARLTPTLSMVQYSYPPMLIRVAAGARHACVVSVVFLQNPYPTTTCWGASESGQVAGAVASRSAPVDVAGMGKVSAGATHTCAITSDNPRAVCWGDDSRGALGDGPVVTTGKSTVVMPNGAAPLRSLAAGNGYSCGMATDGRAYCWGRNDRGQLGDGSSTDSPLPVLVGGGTIFDPAGDIAAGAAHACARRADGVVLCWGRNDRGQLGEGSMVDRAAPVQVGTTPFVMLTAGDAHTCALTAAGTAFCWGANDAGQLGIGTAGVDNPSPQPVSAANGFKVIAAGGAHTCALAAIGESGAPYCWGLNTEGQLGDGTTTNRAVPTPVADFHP
jgi:alpha-tubulin suppressor-like RCC1 family protein